ncbi:MAG: PQQ-dependent sugar dehydrogenase [Acidimicrobiia bacterium]
MRSFVVALVLVALVACSGDDGDRTSSSYTSSSSSTSSSTAGGPSEPTGDLGAVRISLTKLADLDRPTALSVLSGDDTLYVTEKVGRIRAVRDGALDPEPVLDVSDQVGSDGNEQGLLGMAFSPDGTHLYLDFTDPDGDTRVVEYTVVDGVIDDGSARELLSIDQPQSNHNGGSLAVGADGVLYIGSGDGGSAGDVGSGHAEGGNGQWTDTLLGKMLRIDPTPSGDAPYSIPADNPFANGGGRPEIFATGLRNPWRFSFDRTTGDLWIADVGQNEWEEIDYVAAGEGAGDNFGWSRLEGTHGFSGDAPDPTTPPIYEYSHSGTGGCSVTGGYVYRGRAIPELTGAYVFADYCTGRLQGLTQSAGTITGERFLDVNAPNVTSFGEDGTGELYVLSDSEGLFRIDAA